MIKENKYKTNVLCPHIEMKLI